VKEDHKRRLKNHANRNIAYLLDKLDVAYTDNGYGLVQAACPCQQHGGDGDNQTAWSWQIDIGKWVCWSHHCEDTRGNDIFGLVSSVLGYTFPGTVKWIEKRLAERSVNVEEEAAAPKYEYRGTQLHIHEPLPEDNLAYLKPDPEYLLNRGFDRDILRDYNVGYWNKVGTFMHDRAVFPVRDHEGHLVGYTGRTVQPKEYFEKKKIKYAKWVHGRHYHKWPQRGELFTGSILFNLNRIHKLRRKLILVEGPLDGMKLEEAGIHNWVATFGTNFCAPHRTLLVQHGITDLYVAYDNDPNQAGEKGVIRLERIVSDLFNVHRVPLPAGKDCGDLSVPFLQETFSVCLN
jgi:hypothetical protein